MSRLPVYSRTGALTSANGDYEHLEETRGTGRRVGSGVLQPEQHSVPPLQIAGAKREQLALAT